jgi:hypothetical protein
VGGRAISEFAKLERVLAETEGVGQAMFFGGLDAITRHVADGFEESGEYGSLISEGKFVRKWFSAVTNPVGLIGP